MKVKFKLQKQVNPVADNGLAVKYGPVKRLGYQFRWFAILCLIISPVLLIAYKLSYPLVVKEAPAVLSSNPIDLVATQTGVVSFNDEKLMGVIKKGEVLYSIEDNTLDAEIAFLKGEIEKFDANSGVADTFALKEKKVEDARAHLIEMNNVYQRYKGFSAKGQVSAVDFTAIVNLYNSAKNELAAAEVDLTKLKATYNLAGVYADSLRAIKKELVLKEGQREKLTVRSPYDAKVLETSMVSGQTVNMSDSLMLIRDVEQVYEVIAYLKAENITSSKVGHKVTIQFPNGRNYPGTIARPTELAARILPQLSKPFETQLAMLKVSIHFDEAMPEDVELMEGLPLNVIF